MRGKRCKSSTFGGGWISKVLGILAFKFTRKNSQSIREGVPVTDGGTGK